MNLIQVKKLILPLVLISSIFSYVNVTFSSEGKELTITQQKCQEIAIDTSFGAFNSDDQGIFFRARKLNNIRGSSYLNTVKKQLHEELKTYCASQGNKLPISAITQKHHQTCFNICQEHKVSTGLFKGIQDNAELTCSYICFMSQEKLKMYTDGMIAGQNLIRAELIKCKEQATASACIPPNIHNSSLDSLRNVLNKFETESTIHQGIDQ